MSTTILFFFTIFLTTVQTQYWPGTYTVNSPSTCSGSSCCCVLNKIYISTVNANTTSFNATLSGGFACGLQSSYAGMNTAYKAYSVNLTVTYFGVSVIITVTLSADDNTLTVAIGSSSCLTTTTRTD